MRNKVNKTIISEVSMLVLLMEVIYEVHSSGSAMALGSTQPLTEISTRNLPWGKGRPVLKADTISPPSLS
jgi:hypothetical protein